MRKTGRNSMYCFVQEFDWIKLHYVENSYCLPFLLKQIELDPRKRSSAGELLEHPYLNEFHPLEIDVYRAIDTDDSVYLKQLLLIFDVNNIECTMRDGYLMAWHPLCFAANHNKYECVKIMVEQFGAHIDTSSALCAAAGNGNKQIVEYLTNQGGDINVQNKNGKTPLMLASEENNVEVVQYLTSNLVMADTGIKDDFSGLTALHHASQKGHLAIVKHLVEVKMSTVKLIAQESDLIDPWSDRDKYGMTELHHACKNGLIDVIEFLVNDTKADLTKTARGCLIVSGDDSAWNPLHFACTSGKVECVIFLLTTGAMDVHAKTERKLTPFLLACHKGDLETVKYLAEEANADVYTSDNTGKNALHHATSNRFGNNLEVIKYLCENCNIDAMATDNAGRNILHYAAVSLYDRIEILKYLLDNCHVDISATDKDGLTAEKLAEQKAATAPEYLHPKVQYLKTARETVQE